MSHHSVRTMLCGALHTTRKHCSAWAGGLGVDLSCGPFGFGCCCGLEFSHKTSNKTIWTRCNCKTLGSRNRILKLNNKNTELVSIIVSRANLRLGTRGKMKRKKSVVCIQSSQKSKSGHKAHQQLCKVSHCRGIEWDMCHLSRYLGLSHYNPAIGKKNKKQLLTSSQKTKNKRYINVGGDFPITSNF